MPGKSPFLLLPLEILLYEIFPKMFPWDFVLWSFSCKEHFHIVYSLGHEWLRVYFLSSCKSHSVFKQSLQPLGTAIASAVENPPASFSGLSDGLVAFASEHVQILIAPWESASPQGFRVGVWLGIPATSFRRLKQSFLIPHDLRQNSIGSFFRSDFLPGGYLSREIYANYIFSLAQASLTNNQKALLCIGENKSLTRYTYPPCVKVLYGGPIVYDLAMMQETYHMLMTRKGYTFPGVIHPFYGDLAKGFRMLCHNGSPSTPNRRRPFSHLLTFSAPCAMYNATHGITPNSPGGSNMIKQDAILTTAEAGSDLFHMELDDAEMGIHFKCAINFAVEKLIHAFFPDCYGGHYCRSPGVTQPHLTEAPTHTVLNATLGINEN